MSFPVPIHREETDPVPRTGPALAIGALVGTVLGGVAWLLTWDTTSMLVSAGAAGLATAMLAWMQLRARHREFERPLRAMIASANEIRRGSEGRRVPEEGAPLLRALARVLNEAWATVDERTRRSQANLLSMEMAFDRIHSVLQSLAEGVIVIDAAGEVLLANPAARQLLSAGNRPIEGRPLVELLQGDLQEWLRESLTQLNKTPRPRSDLFGVHHGQRVYDVSVVRVRSDRPDHDFGMVVVLTDVTRNHEIARLKDEFLSNVSHELRTPLTNILAFTEILLQMTPGDSGDWKEFMSIVNVEARRLKKLVDDVLDFTDLESGRARLQCEDIDIVQLVRAAVDVMAPLAGKDHIVIDFGGSDPAAIAHVDRDRIHQVLVKLLDNAIRFTPAGGKLRIEVENIDDQVRVSIDDSGRGVPEDQREHVFEKFAKDGQVLTDKSGGQGLSLAICRRVLSAMGGMIWCEASDLGGARFRFVVPARVPAAKS